MGRLFNSGKLVGLGLVVLTLCLVSAVVNPAQAVPLTDYDNRPIGGGWGSTWKVENVTVLAGLAFTDDGSCTLVMLDRNGKQISTETGRYTYHGGVLTMVFGSRRIVESIRWLNADNFVFVGGEESPWTRLDLNG